MCKVTQDVPVGETVAYYLEQKTQRNQVPNSQSVAHKTPPLPCSSGLPFLHTEQASVCSHPSLLGPGSPGRAEFRGCAVGLYQRTVHVSLSRAPSPSSCSVFAIQRSFGVPLITLPASRFGGYTITTGQWMVFPKTGTPGAAGYKFVG